MLFMACKKTVQANSKKKLCKLQRTRATTAGTTLRLCGHGDGPDLLAIVLRTGKFGPISTCRPIRRPWLQPLLLSFLHAWAWPGQRKVAVRYCCSSSSSDLSASDDMMPCPWQALKFRRNSAIFTQKTEGEKEIGGGGEVSYIRIRFVHASPRNKEATSNSVKDLFLSPTTYY